MAKMNITFSECENSEDLERYQIDVENCSGNPTGSSIINFEEGECTVRAHISDYETFIEKFKKTDSYKFSSLCD